MWRRPIHLVQKLTKVVFYFMFSRLWEKIDGDIKITLNAQLFRKWVWFFNDTKHNPQLDPVSFWVKNRNNCEKLLDLN